MRPDAFLLLSFGGPERPEDVLPFLRRVTGGRGVPEQRLRQVAGNYAHFGGRSPINDANRRLLAAMERRLPLPCYWGNRNWRPFLSDTLARMADDGCRHAVVLATSAFPGWSSCGQYRADLARAAETLRERGLTPPALTKLRPFWDLDGFLDPLADGLRRALDGLPEGSRAVCTAHSIPRSAADSSGYARAITAAAAQVAAKAGVEVWDLAWQSRSGPPSVPWLEPSVEYRLAALAAEGVPGVALCPVGFVSDHMEIVYDLDVQAAGVAAEAGLAFARCPTPGTDERFLDAVAARVLDLVECRADPSAHDCPAGCCAPPAR